MKRLGLLATLLLFGACGSDTPTSPQPPQSVIGSWGGDHISMSVTASGAAIEYDCAHGSIDEPLVLDASGRFDLRGVHVRERGGPISTDDPPDRHPASYSGQIIGKTMTLRVVTTDSGQEVGTFTLRFGESGRIMKCL